MSESQRHTRESASAACDALALLRDGWADVDSIAPTAESIDAARSLALAMVDLGCEFEIDGDVNGHAAITMNGPDGRIVWFSIITRRSTFLILSPEPRPSGSPIVDIDNPESSILRAIEWVSP